MSNYISPKQRQLARLHSYRERLIGELATINSFLIRQTDYPPDTIDDVNLLTANYYDILSEASIQAEKLIEELKILIKDLEENV